MAMEINLNIRIFAIFMLICFDVDGTLLDDVEFIWYTLHEHFGVDFEKVKRWHRMFIDGKITYEQWFDEDIRWWDEANARKADFMEAVARLSLMPGALETITELKKRGHKLGIISGSINIVIDHFFPKSPFDHMYINEIYFDHKGRISGRKVTEFDVEGKAEALRIAARKEGLDMKDTVFVGDNYNDVHALKAAGMGIAFNAKSKEVEKAADIVVKEKDLRRILGHI